MNNRIHCPECGSSDTQRVHTEWLMHAVEETRICDSCPTQCRNKFHGFTQEVDDV